LLHSQALAAEHPEVRLLLTEGRDRVGGNITTCSSDGYLWEEGPNSFQPSDAMLKAAVRGGGRSLLSVRTCLLGHGFSKDVVLRSAVFQEGMLCQAYVYGA
jgi:hypothetical protein